MDTFRKGGFSDDECRIHGRTSENEETNERADWEDYENQSKGRYVDFRLGNVPGKDKELGYVFDTSWNTDTFNEEISVPVKYGVSSLCDGFSTALQNMRIGDRWLVYMPYELGYGTTDYGVIPAYSTLVFDMALAAFYRVGTTVPQWSSNEGFLWEENY